MIYQHLQIGGQYSITRNICRVTTIRTFPNIKVRVIELETKDGKRFVLNQWDDGSIFRINYKK